MALHPHSRNIIALCHDLIMAACSVGIALYLRMGSERFAEVLPLIAPATILFVVIAGVVFSAMRLYRGMWRYASAQDMTMIIRAVTIAIVLFTVCLFIYNRLEGMPRSALAIQWGLLIGMLAGPRLLWRAWRDGSLISAMSALRDSRIPVIVVGAGDNAELFLRETSRMGSSNYRVVALADDDPERIGRHMRGVPIFGPIADMGRVIEKCAKKGRKPQKILLSDARSAIPISSLLDIAEKQGLTFAQLPSIQELKEQLQERFSLRPIVIEDLLERPQNTRDISSVEAFVTDKVVLVTGAGGSIGSELVRQLAEAEPTRLILVDHAEYNLYRIEREMHESSRHTPKLALLADVRDTARMEQIFSDYKPDIVFHAAAIKHVPIAEDNPMEAIMTNVIGTRNVVDIACSHNTKAVVMISTDKAVNPTNIMGATKRLAEQYCHAYGTENTGSTKIITVRFGNVLGSTGSVVPLFRRQIEKGGPITITNPHMTRYFMTIREAVELVIQAGITGCDIESRNGFIFVLDMGEPVKITDLAYRMVKLSGLEPEKDVKIEVIGTRPGEKLHEELFYPSESLVPTQNKGVMMATADPETLKTLRKGIEGLEKKCATRQKDGLIELLEKLVPEYSSA